MKQRRQTSSGDAAGADVAGAGTPEAVRGPSPTPPRRPPARGRSGRVSPAASGGADAPSEVEVEVDDGRVPDEAPLPEDPELSSSEKRELSARLRAFTGEAIVSRLPEPSGLEGIDSGGNWWYGGAVGQDGKIFCIPGLANHVLQFDPETESVKFLEPDLDEFDARLSNG